MKTNIRYEEDEEEINDRKALHDMLHWYDGFRQFKLLVRYIKSGCSCVQLATACEFSGVEGYPISAMWRRYHGKLLRRRYYGKA